MADLGIGIDKPTSGRGQEYAQVFVRKGIRQLLSTWTVRERTKGELHQRHVDALRDRGWNVRNDGVVEWTVRDRVELLLS